MDRRIDNRIRGCLMAVLGACAALAGTAVAEPDTPTPLDRLAAYFESVETLEGEFRQTTRDEAGTVVEEAAGSFVMARPQRFIWDYDKPWEQLIVADGEQLWVHDVALEQVVVRPLDDALGVGAAQLLSGDFANLKDNFELSVTDDGRIRMRPTDPAWNFQRVHLTLEDGVPAIIEVQDGMGQRVSVELLAIERNPDVDFERFEFEPPEGVDVMQGA
jgi:chaperone LolA